MRNAYRRCTIPIRTVLCSALSQVALTQMIQCVPDSPITYIIKAKKEVKEAVMKRITNVKASAKMEASKPFLM